MKRIFALVLLLTLSLTLTACGNESTDDGRFDNVITFEHLDGYGLLDDRDAYILFEYRMRDYVKYQLAYVACTCRAAEVNFWKVAYVEIGLQNHELRKISFNQDGTDSYTAGFWGDSDPIPPYGNVNSNPETWLTLEDFEEGFIPWLEGSTLDSLDGIYVFTNEVYPGNIQNDKVIEEQDLIDAYAGSSVTTNNMIRAMRSLLEYHNEKYNN